MSSRLNDRDDSLVLQRRGRRVLRLGRVTTMLADDGLLAGKTRGIANVRRVLEQNKVLRRRLLRLRVGTGGILRTKTRMRMRMRMREL
jgi:hypothetical protein